MVKVWSCLFLLVYLAEVVSMATGVFALSAFLSNPSWEELNVCRKHDLFAIAAHFELNVSRQMVKEDLKTAVSNKLVDEGLLPVSKSPRLPVPLDRSPNEGLKPAVLKEEGQNPAAGEQQTVENLSTNGSPSFATPSSPRSRQEVLLKVRLAKLQLEAQDKAQARQAELELRRLELETETEKVLKLKKLELELQIEREVRLRQLELQAQTSRSTTQPSSANSSVDETTSSHVNPGGFNKREDTTREPPPRKDPSSPRRTFAPRTERECFYCHKLGHVVVECPALKRKNQSPKGVGLIKTICAERRDQSEGVDPCFKPFLLDGTVSLTGKPEDGKPIRILRDTGGSRSVILSDVLPLSDHSSCHGSILIQGVEMGYVEAPLHYVHIKSKLVNGIFSVAVRPSLPIKGVQFILGNDIAGGKVQPVPEFRERLHKARLAAAEALSSAQGKMKSWYDKKAVPRSFNPGDKVLVLLPTASSALSARFCGPYQVDKKD
ncbi:uncharacterized protein LOC120739179 [Simochromis diagramma]|uniref:uncharacterized protein LOC120739179 n=1 Tax=Simochromis diagramma TaxID=43689 RepID=UPI001A7EE59A|nr:uncharacterized protein LOC120739179 [Simochromis diagramma]